MKGKQMCQLCDDGGERGHEPASAQSLFSGGLCVNDKQWPVRLEIKRHIAPPDKWHWCVIFNGGHIYAVSETFESAEICVVDAGGAGMDALHGAERCLTHNVELRGWRSQSLSNERLNEAAIAEKYPPSI